MPLARRAASEVIEGLTGGCARANGTASGEVVLGLATGSSPLGLYRELAIAQDAGRIDFGAALGFALDEYVGLPSGHPQSYREVLLREVCGPLGLARERLHVPDGSPSDEESLIAAAADYERAIAAAGGGRRADLGIGVTATSASTSRARRSALEPGSSG